jgi:RNA 2',3'-cyclic 3'-phosphodiesterase
MRLFVALQIPEAVRNSLTELSAELKKICPRARWAPMQNAHVTLKFIGEVSPDQAKSIRDALGHVADPIPVLMPTSLRDKIPPLAPFQLIFAGLGFFPDAKRPRTFWAGVDGGPKLARLASAIEDALAPLGIPREQRDYHPHITLARLDASSEVASLRASIANKLATEFGRAKVVEFSLFQSVLKSAAAEHTRLATYPLSLEHSS